MADLDCTASNMNDTRSCSPWTHFQPRKAPKRGLCTIRMREYRTRSFHKDSTNSMIIRPVSGFYSPNGESFHITTKYEFAWCPAFRLQRKFNAPQLFYSFNPARGQCERAICASNHVKSDRGTTFISPFAPTFTISNIFPIRHIET